MKRNISEHDVIRDLQRYRTLRPEDIRYRSVFKNGRWMAVPDQRYGLYLSYLSQRVARMIEPLLAPGCHAYRRSRSVTTALRNAESMSGSRKSGDIVGYFSNISQSRLHRLWMSTTGDDALWLRLEPFLPTRGLNLAVAVSHPLSNLYLNEIDHRFPEMVRYSDNVILTCCDINERFHQLDLQLQDIGLELHKIQNAPATFCKQQIGRREGVRKDLSILI
jgi:hypothetical protein